MAKEGFKLQREQYLGIADQYGFDPKRTVPDVFEPKMKTGDAFAGLDFNDAAKAEIRGFPPGTTLTDPKTGKKYRWDGSKLNPL